MSDGWDAIHAEPVVEALMAYGIDRPHILRLVKEPADDLSLDAMVAEFAGSNAAATQAALDAEAASYAHCRALLVQG